MFGDIGRYCVSRLYARAKILGYTVYVRLSASIDAHPQMNCHLTTVCCDLQD